MSNYVSQFMFIISQSLFIFKERTLFLFLFLYMCAAPNIQKIY